MTVINSWTQRIINVSQNFWAKSQNGKTSRQIRQHGVNFTFKSKKSIMDLRLFPKTIKRYYFHEKYFSKNEFKIMRVALTTFQDVGFPVSIRYYPTCRWSGRDCRSVNLFLTRSENIQVSVASQRATYISKMKHHKKLRKLIHLTRAN